MVCTLSMSTDMLTEFAPGYALYVSKSYHT